MRQSSKRFADLPGDLVSVDPLHDAAWLDLLERAPASTLFHHPAWLRLIHGHYGYAMSAWCLPGADGRLAAGIPLALVPSHLTGTRLIALPFSDSCPPLFASSAGIDPARLAQGVASACSRFELGLEVRGALPGSGDGIVQERYVQHELTLDPDVEAVVEQFTKSYVMRGVAKARREGVAIERRTDRDALVRFFGLHTLTRRFQGVPTQPRRFILGFSELFDAGLGFVAIARYEGHDIAAAVFLTDGRTLTYKFGASDRRYLGLRPNNLLFMEAIRWGCENGQQRLDFGRTDHDNAGLRAFKSTWGATESPLAFTYFGGYNATLGRGRLRHLTGTAIRHTPPSFGRLIGQAFYRHFG
jgi:CelD/BcsL family acetyltransferase involved in cellulose biosynthesis